jgi:hypothetical protein
MIGRSEWGTALSLLCRQVPRVATDLRPDAAHSPASSLSSASAEGISAGILPSAPVPSPVVIRPPVPSGGPGSALAAVFTSGHPAWRRLAATIAAVILASLLGLVALVGANTMMDKSASIAQQVYNDGIVTTVSATPPPL